MGRITNLALLVGLAAAVGACTATETGTIISEPNAVNVAVNGQTVGTTPTEYKFAFPEDFTRHTVTGRKRGYHTASVTVSQAQLKASGRVQLTLESQRKRASINSNPSGADIWVGNRKIGRTPAQHTFSFRDRNRQYTITVGKAGYHPRAVVVSENGLKRSNRLNFALEPHEKSALITSEPQQATVSVADQDVGRTPTEYAFNFEDRSKRYKVTVSRPGYFDHVMYVSEGSEYIEAGTIEVVLEEDPAWVSTSESEATNRWLRIPVNPDITHASAWQKVIDSVTTVYNSLEQLDQTSGYLRSAPRLREYDKGPDGPYYVRTQFIGSISSLEPLTYKIKLIARTRLKRDAAENWRDFGRVFAEDAQLVEELLNRLGLK